MNRNYAVDYFKFFAIISIVCIHTNPFSGINLFGISGFVINDFIINVLARFGVPFFFVSSGYLFSRKIAGAKETKIYLKKYVFKIGKLFICWYLFFALYGLGLYALQARMEGNSIILAVSEYLKSFSLKDVILYGSGGFSSYHLWYLLALLWSTLIIYICYKYNKIMELLIVGLVLNLIGLFGQTYSGIFYLDIQTRDTFFFGLFYTTLGFFFASNELSILRMTKKITSKQLLLLFIIFSLMQIFEKLMAEILWSDQIKAVDYYFFTILSTISLFLFVMKNSQLGNGTKITKIGANSVGIYVSHTFFIGTSLLIFKTLNINITSNIIFHLLFTPIVILLSYYYYLAIQKIKARIA